MYQIDRGCGSVILTHAANHLRIVDCLHVIRQRPRIKKARRLGLAGSVGRKPGFRRGIDESLWKRMQLSQPEPVIIAHREGHVGPLEMFHRGNDIEERQLPNTLGIVNGQPVTYSATAIMPSKIEVTMSEQIH